MDGGIEHLIYPMTPRLVTHLGGKAHTLRIIGERNVRYPISDTPYTDRNQENGGHDGISAPPPTATVYPSTAHQPLLYPRVPSMEDVTITTTFV